MKRYIQFLLDYDIFPGTGGWALLSRQPVPGDEYVEVDCNPEDERLVKRDAIGREWFHVTDRHHNPVHPTVERP